MYPKGELVCGEAAALSTTMSGVEQLITKILKSKKISVVGLSKNLSRPSHDVAMCLQTHGYRIGPVNPAIHEVLGEKSCGSLLALPEQLKREVDAVGVFRRAENVPPLLRGNSASQMSGWTESDMDATGDGERGCREEDERSPPGANHGSLYENRARGFWGSS